MSDAALVEAVDRAKRGLIDADLGGKVGHQAAGRSSRSRQKRRLSYVDRIRF
ncbi:type II toxin-antitoxin system RelE/ParE family toxin [Bradyrhizobium sp. CCGUVB23]|nr:type II toxin-antitoxin system RelE/ParE family toxin [Bradyrhizobium sp. CCGUVB23]MCP3460658.1 type II toxin-antitoxin system RelE/ParE family toxin [Bradyrhizobium sp. CCGUVB23]